MELSARPIQIAPSVLSADVGRLAEQVRAIVGADCGIPVHRQPHTPDDSGSAAHSIGAGTTLRETD